MTEEWWEWKWKWKIKGISIKIILKGKQKSSLILPPPCLPSLFFFFLLLTSISPPPPTGLGTYSRWWFGRREQSPQNKTSTLESFQRPPRGVCGLGTISLAGLTAVPVGLDHNFRHRIWWEIPSYLLDLKKETWFIYILLLLLRKPNRSFLHSLKPYPPSGCAPKTGRQRNRYK